MTEILIAFAVALFTIILTTCIALVVKFGDRVSQLEKDMAVSKTQLQPLWATAQDVIIRELHHPNHPEMDGLLEKLQALTITPEERIKLKQMLLARSTDRSGEITEEERKSASLLIGIMDKVIIEAATISDKIINAAIVLVLWASVAIKHLRY